MLKAPETYHISKEEAQNDKLLEQRRIDLAHSKNFFKLNFFQRPFFNLNAFINSENVNTFNSVSRCLSKILCYVEVQPRYWINRI